MTSAGHKKKGLPGIALSRWLPDATVVVTDLPWMLPLLRYNVEANTDPNTNKGRFGATSLFGNIHNMRLIC